MLHATCGFLLKGWVLQGGVPSLDGPCSLTLLLRVIITALRRSVAPLCSPFTLEWDPRQPKHRLSSQGSMLPSVCVSQTLSVPPLRVLLHSSQLSGEWRLIQAYCINPPPPRPAPPPPLGSKPWRNSWDIFCFDTVCMFF